MLKPLPDDAVPVDLTKGFTAYVSPVDYEWVSAHKWSYNGDGSPYAKRSVTTPEGVKRKLYLHREIMVAPPGLFVNHKDGNTMNCTRGNLETVKPKSNSTTLRLNRGMVGYIGVSLRGGMRAAVEGRKCYRVRITIGDEYRQLGYFYTAEEGARAYDRASVQHFGIYAETNFPITDYLCPGIREWGFPEYVPKVYPLDEVPF